MAAKNDITGDSIQTRGTSEAYRDNYDLIFGKKKKAQEEDIEQKVDNGTPDTQTDEG